MKKTVTLIGALLLICALLLGCDLPAPEPVDTTQETTETNPVGSIQESTAESTDDPEPTTEQPTEQPTEEPTRAPETDAPTTEETTEEPTTEEITTEAVTESLFSPDVDPYVNMSAAEFYSDYEPAEEYWDAYWRTQHGFMSGSIEPQDQKPTIAEQQPTEDGMLVRNTHASFSEDGNTYYIVDYSGQVVSQVHKGAAYVSLEEVAAYVFAFGNIPANYSNSKKTDPDDSIWGEYLRVNHTRFSGSTTKYPYEPELPDISGCGGRLEYYEIDIGTTGTDCDPSYRAEIYNNGHSITRGAARIVYARFDVNGDKIIDINERYVFYTYNHYNDFQEYLNYYGGWGEIFGNITGGGKISDKYNCNPTPYVPVARRDFVTGEAAPAASVVVYYYVPRFSLDAAA
jgi:hypothetical protein